jgi:hypothetical protein
LIKYDNYFTKIDYNGKNQVKEEKYMDVLLIEDDIQLNTTISHFLQFNQFVVTSLGDGDRALTAEYI